ncbi:MAG: bacteriohemerythrin [Oscillospiraceae bacterium]|nr:bacteriohemerythrin [Oscillospiraceae bacterium]
MAVFTWSDDYNSGFEKVDEQHKALFEMINDFAAQGGEGLSNSKISAFLFELNSAATDHFLTEEEIMLSHVYPLLEHHKDAHRNIKEALIEVRSEISRKAVKNPFMSVMEICTGWLNDHILQEDVYFFNYCRNRKYNLGRHFVGRKCEILAMDNEFLTAGKISRVDMDNVVINNLSRAQINVDLNDIVKVSSLSDKQESQTFIAKVFFSQAGVIKLFNATIIQTENNRTAFRVPVKIEAVLTLSNDRFPVLIRDISQAGLRIETTADFEVGGSGKVVFTLQDRVLEIPCEVLRSIKRVGATNTFALKFPPLGRIEAETVTAFVLNKQAQARRKKI